MNSTQELHLIDCVAKGDHSAFRALVELHHVNVFNLVLRIVRQREVAEEVAQDVFLKVFRSIATYKGGAKFSTWLFRVAYNEAVSHTRKKRLEFVDLGSIEPTEDPETEFFATIDETEDEFKHLEQAVKALNDEAQLLLDLYYHQGLSVGEIGEVIGQSESNVKVRLFRIRKSLKDTLEGAKVKETIH